MRFMKNSFAMIIVAIICFALMACGETTTIQTTEAPTTEAPTTEATTITTTETLFEVTFNTLGGELIDSVFITEGDTVITPSLERDGYIFMGWYTDFDTTISFEASTVPSEDITLYAGWNELIENNVTLIIHYYRFAQDYDDWNIFLKAEEPFEGETSEHTFNIEEKFWRTLTIELTETEMLYSTKLSFYIKNESLDLTDISVDRFIELDESDYDSEINMYLVQGNTGIFSNMLDAQESMLMENIAKDYYATGQFNGWDAVQSGLMTPTSMADSRIYDIRSSFPGAEYIYVSQINLLSSDAGWEVFYIVDGINTIINGNLAVKIIRTTAGYPDSRDWWAQSPESGDIINLTPDTLFIPEFTETYSEMVVFGGETYTTGHWNDNPVALEAGAYYFVFIEYLNGTRGMGLVSVTLE